MAVIGGSSSGKEVLGQVLARLTLPTGGSIKIDGNDFFQLPEYVLGARTAYVGQETYLFPLSVRDNLLFGLKIRPVAPATYDDATQAVREAFWKEAERAGNPPLDPNADWIDYELAGATGPADLLPRMVDALKQVELDEDIYSLGLRGTIDAALRPDLAEKILKARHVLHGRLQDPSYAGLVETVQRRPLQPQPVGGREPAVRHAGRQAVRRRQHRRRPLRAVGAAGDRPRPRPAAHGPHHRRDHGRAVLRPVARQSAVRAVQLHLGRRAAQRPPAAATPGRQGHRGRARRRPAAPDDPAVPLHRGAPSPRPDRRGDGGAPAGGAARLRRRPAGRAARRRRILRLRALQQRRHPAGQHPVRPPGLRPGPGRAAHRHADRRGAGRARPAQFGDRGRARTTMSASAGKRLPADPAPEARHRARADQAAAAPDRQRGGRRVRRPHAGPHPRQHPGGGEERKARRGLDRQPAGAGRTVRADRGHAGRHGSPPRARRPTWRRAAGSTPN